jgi:hypothetical protein
MSDAILTAIKTCGGSDAFEAFKKAHPGRAAHSYTVSDVSVTTSFVGYVYTATIRVTTNLVIVKNTTVHRIELIYGQDGAYRQLKSLVAIPKFTKGFRDALVSFFFALVLYAAAVVLFFVIDDMEPPAPRSLPSVIATCLYWFLAMLNTLGGKWLVTGVFGFLGTCCLVTGIGEIKEDAVDATR